MFHKRLLIVGLLLLLSSTLAIANPVTDKIIHITESDTIFHNAIKTGGVVTVDGFFGNDLMAACRSFSLHGTVEDNLIVACQMASIRGKVHGDILAFAQSVDIDTDSVGDTRVFCQTFDINNHVNGDILAFAQDVRIGPNTVVDGNVIIGADKVYIEGKILGDAKIMANELYFEGEIEGNLDAEFVEFDFTPRSKVWGNFTYHSEDYDITGIEDIVKGRIVIEEPEMGKKEYKSIKGLVFNFLSAIATAFLLVIFFKKRTMMILETGKTAFWKNGLIGLIGLVLIPVVFVISLLLVVTIPASVILLVVYGILVYLAWVTAGIFIGHMIFKWIKREDISLYIAAPVGVIIFVAIIQIPVLGNILCTLGTILGFGLILSNIYDLFWTKKEVTIAE